MKNILLSQTIIPLYPGSIPNSKPTKDEEATEVLENGIVITSKISKPTLTIFLPEKNGEWHRRYHLPWWGYWVNASIHEGSDVAKEFTKWGVTAFVLKYRIPDMETMTNPETGPLQDAQQAIKMVRERATEWNIDTGRIGIMGFSAGGHLASTAGTQYKKSVVLSTNKINLRPDFMILIYPVITFVDTIVSHKGSAEKLLGKDAPTAKLKEYSGELNVTSETPPAFLVHAGDDDGVSPKNSLLFYEALLQYKVHAEMHIYQSGGHGFGLHIKNSSEQWIERCRNWLQINGWLAK